MIIVDPDGKRIEFGWRVNHSYVVRAEIDGYLAGLEFTTEGSEVTLYYDIVDLPRMLDGNAVSYQRKLEPAISGLIAAIKIRTVSLKLASGHGLYRRCHSQARKISDE